jgi:hypothetical protein
MATQHMRTLAGPDASLLAFTNLSSATSASLSAAFTAPDSESGPSSAEAAAAAAQVECHEQGVLALMRSRNIPRERVCLLDPKASLALSPSDGDGDGDAGSSKFTWFLFGVRHRFSPHRSPSPIPLGLGYPRYVKIRFAPTRVTADDKFFS